MRVRGLFEKRWSSEIQGTVVWVPVLPADTLEAAESRAGSWPDHRVTHLWDGTGEVNRQFARRLSLTGPGWDLYLIYGHGIRWEEELPAIPTFWMHQLSPAVGADPALCLSQDPSRLERVLDELLTRHTSPEA